MVNKKNYLLYRGAAVLAGATIGIGFFSLPLTVFRFGLGKSLVAYLAALAVMLCLNIFYSRLVLAASGDHQLAGYGKIYLGKRGFFLGSLVMIVSLYGALLAYLVKFGQMINFFIPRVREEFWLAALLLLAVVLVKRGIKSIARLSSLLNIALVAALIGALLFALPYFSFSSFFISGTDKMAFIKVMGIFFFSLSGTAVIPEVEETMRLSREKLTAAIVLGTLFPALLYLFFIFEIIGVCAPDISEEAVLCFQGVSPLALFLGSFSLLTAIITSFLSLSFSLREFWHRDLGFSFEKAAWLTFLPLIIFYALGARSFLDILSFSGGISTLLLSWLIFDSYYHYRLRLRKKG